LRAVTLVGAGVLMGTDNSLSGVESKPVASEQVIANTQQAARPAPPAPPTAQPVIADWVSDDELIDTAEGFDPSPEQAAEIVDDRTGSDAGGNSASSNPKPGGGPAGVAASSGPAPSRPASARRSRALDVK